MARLDHKLSTICRNVFSDLCPACLSDRLNVYTLSKWLRSPADTLLLHIMVKLKLLANALSLTELQSNEILSLPTPVTFHPPMPSKLR